MIIQTYQEDEVEDNEHNFGHIWTTTNRHVDDDTSKLMSVEK